MFVLYAIRSTLYAIPDTSYERQATSDEFALFWSFYVSFCAFCADFCTFCASLWLIMHLFTQLLNKAISMALWTKAITCDKAGFKSRFCQEHQAGKNTMFMILAYLSSRSLLILLSCLISLRAFCAFLWLKNPFNPRNPWLINDLRSTKVYVRKNKLFLQNEPKFQKVKWT